jgi:putative membrane protein
MYSYVKAIHIVSVVSWFAGLFYLIRLFIYHVEAFDKEELEKNILHNQYKIMEQRLWSIITLPASILTLVTGSWMLYLNQSFLNQPWMHIKLTAVVLLFMYQFKSVAIMNKLGLGEKVWTSTKLRLWNEVATILLVAIVFLVVVQNSMSMLYGVLGLVALGVTMMIFVKIYKKRREKEE